MSLLEIKHLAPEHLPAAVEIDRVCFGGIWTLEAYRREIDSSNSELLGLWVCGRQSGGEGETCVDLTFSSPLPSPSPPSSLPSLSPPSPLPSPSPSSPPSLIGIGCLWAILEEAHITILAIHPDYQRQSLGQALLYTLLKSARQRQLEWATLEVRASNLAAISLYQKFGFQEAGRRRRYYEDTGEDALILWRGGVQKPEFEEDLAQWEQEIRDRLAQSNWQGFRQ